jgi:hypothetical protein
LAQQLPELYQILLVALEKIGQNLHRAGRESFLPAARADIFNKVSKGLQNNPKMMLLGDPNTQARWYFELKKAWQLALENETQFLNPLKAQALEWIT